MILCRSLRGKVKIHDPRYQTVLKRLRAARVDAGLSQSEAARRLGKTQAFIWKSEVGERRVDFVELLLFAQIYSKPVSYFSRGITGQTDA